MSDINHCKKCNKCVGITDELTCSNCGERICVYCGCTDSAACDDGGCYWARPGVCSRCCEQVREKSSREVKIL